MFSFSQQNWVSLLRSNINVMKKCNPNECRAGIDITYTTPIILGINNIYSLLNTMYQLTLQWPTKYSGDDPIYYIIHISLAWHCKFYMQTVMIILCSFLKALRFICNVFMISLCLFQMITGVQVFDWTLGSAKVTSIS